MRSKLFTFVLAAAAMAVAASATIPAVAATSTTTLNVPFSFSVNGKICPAGDYTVERDLRGGMVKMSSADASEHFTWLANSTQEKKDRVTLQFDVQGQKHTLRSVQSGYLVTGALDRKSHGAEDMTPQDGVGL